MDPIIVRHAQPEDDARIGELLIEAFIRGYARRMPEVVVTEGRKADLRDVASKRASGSVLVLERAGEILGSVTLLPPGAPTSRAWTERTADLRYMGLDPKVHGRGLSGVLLDAVEKTAREWGCQAICLHVRRGAEGVSRTYVRKGYVRTPEGDQDQLPEIFLEAFLFRIS